MNIAVLNKSTLLSNADVASMCRLVSSQVHYQFCPAWGLAPSSVTFYADETKVPAKAPKIAVFDDSDTPGAAGWHSDNAGVPFGRVFVRPVFNVSGGILMADPTVCSILSHECGELLVDPTVTRWGSDLGIHGSPRLYALEVADPVEADSYTLSIGGTRPVSGRVSNFVLPAWFDPTGNPGPYDYLHKLTAPFTMTPRGYLIYEDEAGSHVVYGDRYEAWRHTSKRGASRSVRRIARESL